MAEFPEHSNVFQDALKILPSPLHESSNLVWINNNEIAIASQQRYSGLNDRGIWIYNLSCNKWHLDIKYPQDLLTFEHQICYNAKTKTLWIYGDSKNMINVNMITKEITIVNSNARYCGLTPKLLLIQDRLHVIGGSDNRHHLIWNEETNKFDEPIYSFPELITGLHGHFLVRSNCKHEDNLYLFGGYDYSSNNGFNSIWKCDIDDGFKWSKLNMELSKEKDYVTHKGYVLTCDGRYVIILQHPKILVFDIENEEIKEFDYGIDSEYAVSGYDQYEVEKSENIVGGYMRKVMKEFDVMIPMDLIILCSRYYCSDTIYCLTYNYTFCRIVVSDILVYLK